MRKSVGLATPCAVITAMALLLVLGACTDMGSSPDLYRPSATLPLPAPRPTPSVVAPAAPAGNTRGRPPVFAERPEVAVHRVRQGETVYDVARQYGIDAYTLVAHNRLSPPYELTAGQRLSIPSKESAPPTLASSRQLPVPSAPADSAAPSAGVPTDSVAVTEAPLAEISPSRPIPRPTPEVASSAPAGTRPAAPSRPAESSPPPVGDGFVWPVDGRIISEFGAKGGGRFNDGVNIAATAGTPVYAANAGVVAYAGNELRGFGNILLIKHPGGWVTAYAHNQELLVGRGERVRRGQMIARVGSSGGVDQPQLHFELRKGKKAVDPLDYLRRPSASANASRDSG